VRTDCQRHLMEPAVDVCGGCVEAYCRACLVYPFGPCAAPYCLACAVTAAGLRQRGARPGRRSRRRQRALVAERKARLLADTAVARSA
jgi:hypothetical protein